MPLSPQHVARHTNSQSMWIFFSSLEPPIWRQEWAQLWGPKGQEAMWLLGWAEASAIAPTSLSAKHKQPIWLPASSGLQETPSQQPPPQPRQAGVIPTEEVQPGQACPFPTAPESPSTAFLLNSRPRIPQGPYPGPMGLCCHWCCSLDRGQPSSHMTHINKSGRGGVVGKFINPYQTAPKLWQMTWQS